MKKNRLLIAGLILLSTYTYSMDKEVSDSIMENTAGSRKLFEDCPGFEELTKEVSDE